MTFAFGLILFGIFGFSTLVTIIMLNATNRAAMMDSLNRVSINFQSNNNNITSIDSLLDIERIFKKDVIDQLLSEHLTQYSNEVLGTNLPLINANTLKTEEDFNMVYDIFIASETDPDLKQIYIDMKNRTNNYNYDTTMFGLKKYRELFNSRSFDEEVKILGNDLISETELMNENYRDVNTFYNSDVSPDEQTLLEEELENTNVGIIIDSIYENDEVFGFKLDITSDEFFKGRKNTKIYKNIDNCDFSKSFITRILLNNFTLSEYVKGDAVNLFEKCEMLNVDEEKVILYSGLKLTLFRMMGKKINKRTIPRLLCSKIKNKLGKCYQVFFDMLNILGNVQNSEGLKVKNVFECFCNGKYEIIYF